MFLSFHLSLVASRQMFFKINKHPTLFSYGMCQSFSRLNSAEKYDQLTGCWEPIASLKEPRSGVGVVAIGQRMYALGGFDGKNYLK